MLHLLPKDILWEIFNNLDLNDFRALSTCCKVFRNLEFSIYMTRKWKTYDKRLWYKRIQWIRKYVPQRWHKKVTYTKFGYTFGKMVGYDSRNLLEPQNSKITPSPHVHVCAKYPLSRVYSKFKFSVEASGEFAINFGIIANRIVKTVKGLTHYTRAAPSCFIDIYNRGNVSVLSARSVINENYSKAPFETICNIRSGLGNDPQTYVCSLVACYKKKIITFYVNDSHVCSFGWSKDQLPPVYPILHMEPYDPKTTHIQIIED